MSAAGVIVIYGKEVLLCKRSNACNFAGYWSIPAGAIEKGEESVMAAMRELFEETRIKLPKLPEFVMEATGMSNENQEESSFYIYKYRASRMLIPKLDFEHTEYGYFTKDNLPQPMCENVIEAIKLSLK